MPNNNEKALKSIAALDQLIEGCRRGDLVSVATARHTLKIVVSNSDGEKLAYLLNGIRKLAELEAGKGVGS